jgi:hypothetical protein
LSQIATLSVPTATVAVTPTSLAVTNTPTAIPPSATSPPAPATPTDVPPTKTSAASSAGGPILTVVTVQGGDPVNVRAAPDSNAPVIALIGAGSDVIVMSGSDVRDAIGQLWVPVSVEGRSGYLRGDLVGPRHVSSMPYPGVFPTPIFVATQAPTASAATPTGSGDVYADYPLIDAADWAKRPEFYTGKRFSVIGKIFNIRELNGSTFFQLDAEAARGDTVAVAIQFSGTSRNLQKDVRLRAAGVGAGIFSGVNSFGAEIGQPQMDAEWVLNPTSAASASEATATAISHQSQTATRQAPRVTPIPPAKGTVKP